jgi:hypothetical protein
MNTDKLRPTKAGVKAALIAAGFNHFPNALKDVKPAPDFTSEDKLFANYLVWDTDFGGAWDDDDEINMHCQ